MSECLNSPQYWSGTGAGHSKAPYLALHPMGFSVPPRLLSERWALTPPFHPYPYRSLPRFPLGATSAAGGMFSVALSVRMPHGITARVYLLRRSGRVTRHRALRSSDFPPLALARSDLPPFQNRLKLTSEPQVSQALAFGDRNLPLKRRTARQRNNKAIQRVARSENLLRVSNSDLRNAPFQRWFGSMTNSQLTILNSQVPL